MSSLEKEQLEESDNFDKDLASSKDVKAKLEVDGYDKSKDKCTENTREENVTNKEGLAVESLETEDYIDNIEFKLVWNKQNFQVVFDADKKIEDLKEHIKDLTGIPVSMQKLMFKGLIKDDQLTLRQVNICKGAKLMVVGSTLKDVLTVTPPSKEKQTEASITVDGSSKPEPLCSKKEHKKVLDKGMPDDVMPGIIGLKEKLPGHPLSGMFNKRGDKVRLTFKLEVDQLWLGTKERTEKIPMSSIRSIISEPIAGHNEYHIMAIQLGPTEASRYWIYWVPAQYIDAIKDTVLGRWQSF